jgi:hypothetical protein
MTESATPMRIIEEMPECWRVVFDYPPFNVVDASIFKGLQDLLARMVIPADDLARAIVDAIVRRIGKPERQIFENRDIRAMEKSR